MNPLTKEIASYLGQAELTDEEFLQHYGMPRRSGRYPWGSGEDPYQHGEDFLSRVEELKKKGWTETPENIKDEFGLTTGQYRMEKRIANYERRALDVARAKSLQADGLGATEIGKKMGGIPESTVRSLLNEKSETRMHLAKNTADFLKERSKEFADDGGMIDVGTGVDGDIGAAWNLKVSKETLNTALYMLEREGYVVYKNRAAQINNPGQYTVQRILCPPGTEYKETYNFDKIHSVVDYISRDGGETFEKKFNYPASMDSKRLQIRYNEDGGLEKDGIVELRRNVADLSLGESRYSQVRILVDDSHYIKGMAVYSDDMPPGVDVVFNTNKKRGTAMTDVLKKIGDDPDNPFGSTIKDADQGGQYWYDPKTGDRVSSKHPGAKLGLINKRADEGDWTEWKDALPSQFLSKQPLSLARKQLNLAKTDKLDEFNDICELTNPTIKKHLLEKFADGCDSAAVNLQAAALPGQKYHVIIPVNSLKDNEIYAPGYDNGTQLALIRYPHGGTFEIPIVTVNNGHAPARQLLGPHVKDAVGINAKVAERLSGADFDGDTVMCIPTNDAAGRVNIKSTKALEGLEGFDPKVKYGPDSYKGQDIRLMSKKMTGTQMGIISNLITDMTLGGAEPDELAAAVRHSMVVIDAAKHKLNYKQSELDNNIAALHKKYQGKATGGAATIISRAKGIEYVDKRQGSAKTNIEGKEWYDPTRPEGAKIYKVADDLYYPVKKYDKSTGTMELRTTDGKKITYNVKNPEDVERYAPIKRVDAGTKEVTYTNKAGDITYKLKKDTQQSTKMAETDDAYSLVSEASHPMERLYADYANSMKALANKARKEITTSGKIEYSQTAKNTYRNEVESLMNKLTVAESNITRERAALRMANATVKAKKAANPNLEKDDIKKIGQQALTKYRQEMGSVSRSKRSIDITDREWEAIQAGAISESKLVRILNNTDIDKLRERATPRSTNTLSQAKINRIKGLANSNFTIAEIAAKCNVPRSTVSKYLSEGVN